MDRPSSRLRSIISTFSDDTATHLSIAFSKHIYPMLDTLPEAQVPPIFSAFQAAEKEVQHTRSLVAKIDFAARKQAFEADLSAAENSRDVSVWLETGTRCTENICDWLPVLWQVGVEKGLNRKLVRECLSFCEEVNRRLVPPRAVAEEWDSLETGLVVTNTSGDLAFSLGKCPLSHAIAWMWLELLVSTRAESDSEDQEVLDEELLDHVRSSTSFRLLQEFVEAQYDQKEELAVVSGIVISHGPGRWSPSRRQAFTRLHKLLHAPMIQAFRESPNFASFQTLVTDAPSLLPALLEVTRRRVHDNIRSRALRIQWESAAKILAEWGTVDDVLKLDCTLADVPMDSGVLAARLALFQRLTNEQDASEDTVWLGKKLLKHAVVGCWRQIAEAFPGWDDAWDWLDVVVQDGQLAKRTVVATADTAMWELTDDLKHEFSTRLRSPANPVLADVYTAAAKRRFQDNKHSKWGLAYDVQRCLTLFTQCRIDDKPVREQIDAELVVQHALSNDYLATVDGVFDALHDGTQEPSIRVALHALRDVLLGTWDTGHKRSTSADASSEKCAKKARTRSM